MALLLETTVGDVVIDLDVEGSPELCKNILKLAKARYYTSSLIYNVQPSRFCQLGDPRGDGSGGACIYGLLDKEEDITKSRARFIKSQGRILSHQECRERGRVVATEMNGVHDTIGSQFLITLEAGDGRALDGYIPPHAHGDDDFKPTYLSLGVVTEDDNDVLEKIHNSYCDASGRPYADIRIERALVIHDPFPDPPGLQELMKKRGVVLDGEENVTASPSYERPPEERVEHRISINQVDEEEDDEQDTERARQREEEIKLKEDKSRAVVLEMLGDLPSADIKAPENVLFVCKLNPITQDEDLELIFSRFDPNVKVEIIRDHESGASLQYAFCEFSTKAKCVQAYFKMDGALIDDRRIKVDFSQSVAKIWDRYNQKLKPQKLTSQDLMQGRASASGPRRGGGTRGGGGFGRGNGGPRNDGGRGGRGQPHRNDGVRGRGGPPPRRHDGGRYNDGPPPRRDDDRRYNDRDWEDRGRYRDDDRNRRYEASNRGGHDDGRYRDERRQHEGSDVYSPRRNQYQDDFGRRRRSRSPSPDVERNRDYKRRKHHSREHHHRHERSYRDNDDHHHHGRRRHHDDDRHSPRRRESEDEGRRDVSSREDGEERHSRHERDHDERKMNREDGEESHSRHRDGGDDRRRHRDDGEADHYRRRDDDDDRRRHRDRHDDERKHRKKHHRRHRDREDRDERRHKKRKHKEKRRSSRSRSAS